MSKLKTKSGAKKRFKVTAKGKIRASAAFLSHNLRKRPQKMLKTQLLKTRRSAGMDFDFQRFAKC